MILYDIIGKPFYKFICKFDSFFQITDTSFTISNIIPTFIQRSGRKSRLFKKIQADETLSESRSKRPESQKLLIIISDGQPADCGYSGTEAEADLRGIKNEYRKRGIVIFAAAIGDDKENIRRIYQDGFLDITKLEDLPKNMTQLVKQYLK